MARLSVTATVILPAGIIVPFAFPAMEYYLLQGRAGHPVREASSIAAMNAGNYMTTNNFSEDTGVPGQSWPVQTKYYMCTVDEVLEIKYGAV